MESQYPQKPVVDAWLAVIKKALEKKESRWGKYAREIDKLYDGPPDYMWQQEREYQKKSGGPLEPGTPLPNFRIQIDKPFQAVALFGPSLFHQYPNVLVEPVQRPEVMPEALGLDMSDPMVVQAYQQQQFVKQYQENVRKSLANIAHAYLNAVQRITNKKAAAREGITECIVKGMGLTYTRIFEPEGTDIRYPISEHLSPEDFVKDSDASYERDVQWKAVRSHVPRNVLAEQWGVPDKDLRGRYQSHASQTSSGAKSAARRAKTEPNQDASFDIVEVWEVFSKNGFGDKLRRLDKKEKNLIGDYSMFGPFCYLVLVEGVPYPLNMPPWLLEEEAETIFDAVQWPIPFWTPPLCGWPVNELGYYFKGQCTYPLPMFKPLMGKIRFVNWCMSFLADKTASASTDYLCAAKKAAETIKQQIEEGCGPYKLLELPDAIGKNINEIVSVLQAPNFHEGIWKMVSEVMEQIDEESGVTELLAGMSGGIRSATEADFKQANTQIRPDDMNQKTEDWLSEMARKEMLAAQWVLEQDEIAAVVGEEAAAVWMQHMATQDFQRVVSDFNYRIEAGSARKPNIINKQRAINEQMQVASQWLQFIPPEAVVNVWNSYHKAWGEANQIDPTSLLLPVPEPGMAPPSEEEVEARKEEQKLMFNAQEHAQDMFQDTEKFELEMDQAERKGELDLSLQRKKNRMAVRSNGR